jgi:hypothetical protein
MANQGIIHLSGSQGGRPYCNSRRAIMSTTPDRIQTDGWSRVCVKCEAVRLRWAEKNKEIDRRVNEMECAQRAYNIDLCGPIEP